ncbi:pyridoxamine 5'-phosphate oxidase family protein [Candidatus Poriferisodalis sp.]|uniref:pyridoxamine 5'-phosphate oxidase family protein n=1 Tax=Candidatus Poriferisodalis sp. TaxID=3101277 RepID=UPI003B515E14
MSATSSVMSWAAFAEACEELAGRVQERFENHQHVVMATIRRDGSPRMSGMEAPIRDGHLWLGMEQTSAKAADLRRDPRLGLHSTPDDEDLAAGDARIEGSAVPADTEQLEVFVRGHHHEIDDSVRLALFTINIARVVLVRVEDRHLVLETWTPDGGLTERRIG